MPGFDKTGPTGEGPMTGRRMGACAGQERDGRPFGGGFGFRNRGAGRGFGRRQGFGRGYMSNPDQSLQNEISQLRKRLGDLESMLGDQRDNNKS